MTHPLAAFGQYISLVLCLSSVYPLGCSLSILPEHLREMDRLRNGTPGFDMEPVVVRDAGDVAFLFDNVLAFSWGP